MTDPKLKEAVGHVLESDCSSFYELYVKLMEMRRSGFLDMHPDATRVICLILKSGLAGRSLEENTLHVADMLGVNVSWYKNDR